VRVTFINSQRRKKPTARRPSAAQKGRHLREAQANGSSPSHAHIATKLLRTRLLCVISTRSLQSLVLGRAVSTPPTRLGFRRLPAAHGAILSCQHPCRDAIKDTDLMLASCCSNLLCGTYVDLSTITLIYACGSRSLPFTQPETRKLTTHTDSSIGNWFIESRDTTLLADA
jgi:hypothetical protein